MRSITTRIALGSVVGVITLGLAGMAVLAQDSRGGDGAFAGRGGRGGPGGPGGPGWRGRGGPMGQMGAAMGFPGALPMIAERLNLAQGQRDQMRAILESHHDEMKALGDRAFGAHQALAGVVIADVVDEAAIRARSADVAVANADAAVAQARLHAEIWQILTPEQQEQAKQLRAAITDRQEQGRQRWGQTPTGPDARRNR